MMTKEQQDRKASFIRELEALAQKYNIAVGGCGCCNSPRLEDLLLPEKEYRGISGWLEYRDGHYTES